VTVDGDRSLGRVDVVMVAPGEAVVSWLDATLGQGSITLRRVGADGRRGESMRAATSGLSRRAGFPRLGRLDGAVLLVWTEDTDPTRLRAIRLEETAVPPRPDVDDGS
jgi:hypothetical protein